MSTVFCKIIDGQIPGEFIFQDDRWVAFLDIFPAAPGHCLLVPRQASQYLSELPGATQASMGLYISALSDCVKKASSAPALSVLIRDGSEAGQEVPHVHIHFIPRHSHAQAHQFASGSYGDQAQQVTALSEWG
ncbi:MAG: HIT family protein, partial [Planctomycetes bacterium]|nr:HIT family protein [Planctomycetota bacterium]